MVDGTDEVINLEGVPEAIVADEACDGGGSISGRTAQMKGHQPTAALHDERLRRRSLEDKRRHLICRIARENRDASFDSVWNIPCERQLVDCGSDERRADPSLRVAGPCDGGYKIKLRSTGARRKKSRTGADE